MSSREVKRRSISLKSSKRGKSSLYIHEFRASGELALHVICLITFDRRSAQDIPGTSPRASSAHPHPGTVHLVSCFRV